MNEERTEWKLLRRQIGTATGWDDARDNLAIQLYDFIPAQGLNLPVGTVIFDMTAGTATAYNDDGEPTLVVNLLEALSL